MWSKRRIQPEQTSRFPKFRQCKQAFMWHLDDGDLASNQHGWQSVAGTGTDAAPFHRVLSPTRQQERFDATGVYVNHYLRELAAPGHATKGSPEPGTASGSGVLVDHAAERHEALARFAEARQLAGERANPTP
jgi:deoxyribodipyrimidine photo-lyase